MALEEAQITYINTVNEKYFCFYLSKMYFCLTFLTKHTATKKIL